MYTAVFDTLKEELEAHGVTISPSYKVMADWEQAEVLFVTSLLDAIL